MNCAGEIRNGSPGGSPYHDARAADVRVGRRSRGAWLGRTRLGGTRLGRSLALPVVVSILLFAVAFASRADDVITNVMSPVVSYQYYDSVGTESNSAIESPTVSYQFYDSLLGLGTNSPIISPIASYQYFDWPGNDVLNLQSSPDVSYYYPLVLPGQNVAVHGQVVDFSGKPVMGATVSAFTENILNATGQTDFNGNYTLPSLPPSVYAFTATKAPAADSKRVVALSLNTAQQDFYLLQITPQWPLQTAVANSTPPSAPPLDGELLVYNGTAFVGDLSSLDSNKMTVVLTHGMNDSTAGWSTDMASALVTKGVSSLVNIVAWNWPNAAQGNFDIPYAQANTPPEGLKLGQALYKYLGSSYQMPLDFVGHSLGTLVNRYAIDYLQGHTNGKVPGASPAWDSTKTHVTLLDEAEVASVLSPGDWKSPIPSAYAWIDNYISEFGEYHVEAVNVFLEKASSLNIVDAHGYAHWWYINSIPLAGSSSTLGFRESFAYYLFSGEGTSAFPSSAYPAGLSYYQSPSSINVFDLEQLPYGNTSGNVEDSTPAYNLAYTPQYVVNGTTAPGWNIGNVSLQSGQYTAIGIDLGMNSVLNAVQNNDTSTLQTLDLVNLPDLEATLHTSSQINNNIAGFHANGGTPNDLVSNSPAYLWLPIFVPSDVKAMAFDFTISGDWNSDSLTFGINNTNLFGLETQFIAANSISTSPLIDVSAYAGQTNIFFFGITGGTSTNCTVQIEGVRFYTLASPQLAIEQTGNGILIAWPSSAGGYSVQTTTNLADPNSWVTLTNVPAIVNLQNTVTNSISGGAQFYRLRQ